MIDICEIDKYLKRNLSEKRYNHSMGVADTAVRLAEHYGADEKLAYITGIAHDCAKEIDAQTAITLLRERYKIQVDNVMTENPRLLHGPLGACIAQDKFEISNEAVLDAIKYHTTGRADMPLLTKIVYIADYIEPNRTYNDVEELRELTYRDLDQGILFSLDYTIGELVKNNRLIHPDTIHCRNHLLIEKDKSR